MLFAGGLERRDDGVKLLSGMGRGELDSDSRLALGDDREAEADHEDAALIHGLCYRHVLQLVPDHDGYDGMRAWDDVEPELGHASTEIGGVLP